MSRERRSLNQVFWDFLHQFTGKRTEVLQTAALPWDENWKLDEKFFKALANWDNQHQHLTFLRVVERIQDAMITCKPFLGLIPDAPFPARSLVLALSHFLQLGVTVAQARGEVFNFVDELSSWVVDIEANFEGGRGKFNFRARRNLGHIRNLVNEILKWGWARLDGRWEMLMNGMSIEDEIREFNQRLSRAREMLSVLQDINTAKGIDEILRQIRKIKELQKSQVGEILDHLKRSQLENERRQFLERILYRHALQDTGYDDQGKAPCDPETRLEVLATIKEWVNDLSERSRNFFWMTGDPGSGKSAITASFARDCKDSGVLWAQFFINRNNESTTNPRFYFPSIVCQMAEHTADPTVTVTIHEILRKKESLLDEMSLDQGLEFFVKAVQAACDLDRSKPVAIIFDGLDETNRNRLEDTASIFSTLFTKLGRRNAKVFISSRTDDDITRPFYDSLKTDSKHVKHLHLDTSESRKDVEIYLRRNLEYLVEKWALDWKQWPGEEQFQKLCDQAGGLFIWAVTVMKFFRGQLEKHGRERRKKILEIFSEKGMGDVNDLYGMILEMTFESDDDDDWEYERFRWIVGFIIALKEPLTIGDLSGLLDLRETPDSDPVDIIHFVTNLRTVLFAGTKNVNNDTIPRLHKSFVEYIISERAGPRFRIDIPLVDSQIAAKCLRLVGRLKNTRERALLPAAYVRYAIHDWTRHLPGEGNLKSGVGVVGGDAEELSRFLSMTAASRKGFVSASGDYRTHMYDPMIGLPLPTASVTLPQSGLSSTIQGVYETNAIAVSSDGTLIASGGKGGAVRVQDSRTHEPIMMAGRHDGLVASLCFSPDSRWLVSGSFDKTVQIWDCRTGEMISSPLCGHTSWVCSVCTDGERIISGSEDGIICIWSCSTLQLIGTPINARKFVCSVALSEGGRIAAGVGHDVCLFDVETRQEIARMKGHADVVWTVAFSPDGSRIVSGSSDNTIRIWDVRTGAQMCRLSEHTGYVRSVAFSPDGRWFASGSNDQTVRVWNSETGQPVCLPLTGHTNDVTSVVFSPDGLFSASFDSIIRTCWSARGKWQKPSQQITAIHLSQHPASSPDDRISLDGHPSVISASCSPDGFLYASSTLEGHISIWNGERKLLWQTNISIHPIHLLRLSKTQLVLSAPNGSTSSWNLSDGKPTREEPINRGPQLTTANISQSSNFSNDAVSWFPFGFDAGLWTYVDNRLICFEGEERSITIVDLRELCG